MRASDSIVTVRRRIIGAAFISAIVLFLASTVAVYQKAFNPVVHVVLRTDHVGNQLQPPSDVKVRGLVVGEVRDVRSSGSGAELDLALRPERAGMIPRDVSARLLPKTLFGERYVSLVPSSRPSRASLADGDVIQQDHSQVSIELEKVLSDLMPLLQAVEPQKLATTLNSVSMALDGRGKQLGETLVEMNQYLQRFNPNIPELQGHLKALADVSQTYSQAAPDLMQALSDMAVNSRTVAEQRGGLQRLFSTVTTGVTDMDTFLRANKQNIIGLNASSRPGLELMARYAPEYPCLFRGLADAVPRLDQVAGKGTDTPGVIRLKIQVTQDRGKYRPGKDTPRYDDKRGPRCYDGLGTPFPENPPGGPPRDGSSHPRGQESPGAPGPASTTPSSFEGPSATVQHSPAEQRLVAALLAPEFGIRPSDVPQWSTLLVGPLYRGAEVSVQ